MQGEVKVLVPSDHVLPVSSTQSITFLFKTGALGMEKGGGIRFAFRHLINWTTPQTTDPLSKGYTTFEASDGQELESTIEFHTLGPRFNEHFPWQNIFELRTTRFLGPGETVSVTFGDRSQGGGGVSIQPFDEPRHIVRVFTDIEGIGNYLPIESNPEFKIVGLDTKRISIVGPSNAEVGEEIEYLVRFEDMFGNPATTGIDEINLIWPDGTTSREFPSKETCVIPWTVKESDSPIFVEVKTASGIYARSNPLLVTKKDGSVDRVFWGDLHGHTLFSDGRGTIDEYYQFARDFAGLDFAAVTDHGFEVTDSMWVHSKKVTNSWNNPGHFVTFNAYEWSGRTDLGGDHNVFFLGDDPPIFRSRLFYSEKNLQMYHGAVPQPNHVKDLFLNYLGEEYKDKVMLIPHFGGRKANPEWRSGSLERAIEVFSEHGRNLDWAQTFLAQDRELSVIASSDDHYGNPGYGYLYPTGDWSTQEIGMGLVAVRAVNLTRESIFEAFSKGRVYATTGDRIIVDIRALEDGKFRLDIVGTDVISKIEVFKQGVLQESLQVNALTVKRDWHDQMKKPKDAYLFRVVQVNGEEALTRPFY